jgi:hypothetical protein
MSPIFNRPILMGLFPVMLLLTPGVSQGQQKDVNDDPKQIRQYLEQSQFSIDTTAQAIILYEKGTAFMYQGNVSYKYDCTAKILHKESISDLGTVYIFKGSNASIRKVTGITYNLENGEVVKQEIEKSDVLKEKISDGAGTSKFNLPSVKEGSVIHYSYVLEYPGLLFVPSWNFQGKYPILYSEYEINVPSYIEYTPLVRVAVPMTKVNRKKDLEQCKDCSYSEGYGDAVQQASEIWVRRDIPAFREEPYMSGKQNYIERVKLHISAISMGGYTTHVYNNWDEYCRKTFYENKEGCGQVFAGNSFLQEHVEGLIKDKTTELEKAQSIFSFVRNNFTKKNENTIDLKKVANSKTGSALSINLLLTAMLRKAGLSSEPVFLSSKMNEKLNIQYPNPDEIDYMVSKITIGSRDYFLDASEKHLPFGTLLPQCYNGYSRVINEKGGVVVLNPDSLKNKNVIMVTLSPSEKDKNKVTLRFDQQYGTLNAINYRKQWTKDSSEIRKSLLEMLNSGSYPATLDKYSVNNLDNPDAPLSLHMEATLTFNNDAETIYFDPYFGKFFEKNPFSSTVRKYPVEMDYQQDINYVFKFNLPEGYIVEDYPKSSALKFTNEGLITLKNVMSYEDTGKIFNLSSRFSTKTTFFNAEEYDQLRAFYERIIEEQNKKIVLKKSI